MNEFRTKILSGQEPGPEGLLAGKKKRNQAAGDSLENVTVPRTESRTANHRLDDRHRLAEETVTARHAGQDHATRLINLSGGGAMIEGGFRPEMWDRVDLELGTEGSIECAVRWLKGKRIGLEFAHETHIDAEDGTRRLVLREVLERNFAEQVATPEPEPAPENDDRYDGQPLEEHSRRAEHRHPLIWNGHIHYDHDSKPVRLRNVSPIGAMIEISEALPVGAEVHLDLGDAGALFATVSWTRGDQVGLHFSSRFDLMQLAKQRPQLTPSRWTKPDYLRDENPETSPWASEWGRLTIPELHRTLKR